MAKMNSGTGGGDAESEELKVLSDDLDSQLDESRKKSDAVDTDDDDEIEFANNPLTKHNNLPPELAPSPGNFLPPPPLPDDTEAEALV